MMEIYFKPKANVKGGMFQFGIIIEAKNRKPDISKFPNFPVVYPKRYVSIQGWFWPLGLVIEFRKSTLSWYSKRLVKFRGGEEWLKDKLKWYGIFGRY